MSKGHIRFRDSVLAFPKLAIPFWGPHNEDYSILGSSWGSPCREPTIVVE